MRLLCAGLIFLCAPALSTALTNAEKKMAAYAQLEKQNQLRFLEKITNINSGTLNLEGVNQVGEIVRGELAQLGFTTRWEREPVSMNRAGTLIAEHHGKGRGRLLLIAHLDTVFLKTAPFHPFSQQQNIAKGQGVIDDKGGIAVLLYALKAMQSAGELQDADIIVALTGDEEDSGKPTTISRRSLIAVAQKRAVTLDFEPALDLSSATTARRGITNWTITTRGNAAHSAAIFDPDVGVGAIFGLSAQLNRMRASLQHVRYLTFNPGLILGGSSYSYDQNTGTGHAAGRENVIANMAMVKGDLRYINGRQKQFAERKMRQIIYARIPGVKSQIEFVDGIPPMPPARGNLDLLRQYSVVSVDLGRRKISSIDPGARGAADISYVAGIVPANLSGLGPTGSGGHTNAERVELDSLVTQTQRAAVLMSRLIKKA
jgi:glutamate carboxypeptidase